jgi:hypothetical protein
MARLQLDNAINPTPKDWMSVSVFTDYEGTIKEFLFEKAKIAQ